jgi:hypothetical protein
MPCRRHIIKVFFTFHFSELYSRLGDILSFTLEFIFFGYLRRKVEGEQIYYLPDKTLNERKWKETRDEQAFTGKGGMESDTEE